MRILVSAEVADATPYDALVLGSAVYLGRWMEDARRLAELVATSPPRPVWLFSSGPVGDPLKPQDEPVEVGDLVTATHAREHQVFAGRLDRHRLGLGEKAVVLALRVPDGDFRDWDAIDLWGSRIVAELSE